GTFEGRCPRPGPRHVAALPPVPSRRTRDHRAVHAPSPMKAVLAIATVSAVLAAGVAPQVARADGDPASDYLLVRKVFLSYELATLPAQEQSLTKAVADANAHGY